MCIIYALSVAPDFYYKLKIRNNYYRWHTMTRISTGNFLTAIIIHLALSYWALILVILLNKKKINKGCNP